MNSCCCIIIVCVEHMRRKKSHLELTAIGNDKLLLWRAAAGAEALHLLDDLLTVDDLAEDDVLAVQPRAWHRGDEELRAVGVWTSVSHREKVWLGVLELEVLVGELLAVDALAAGAVLAREVTTLAHELRDDAVEG